MKRCDQYFELLSEEGFQPDREPAKEDLIHFDLDEQHFGLYVPSNDSEIFVMLYQRVPVDYRTGADLCLSTANNINVTERGIRCWYESDYHEVTMAYEAFSYGVDDFDPFLANLLDNLRSVKAGFFQALDERGRSVATPVVLEQCGETHNKVKWAARLGDTTFNFYIPKWRVPEPWPGRIP